MAQNGAAEISLLQLCPSCVTFYQFSHRLDPHLCPQPGEVCWSPAWAGAESGELQPVHDK